MESANNSTSASEHPFIGLIENQPFKVFSLATGLSIIPVNVVLLYGIIWFERFGSSHNRTLMNKLVAWQCWNLIAFNLACHVLESLIYISGNLPAPVCFLNIVLKNASKTTMLLLLDSTIIVQYLLIFRIKNPAAVNDDFWSRFIGVWIAGLLHIFNFSKYFIAHRQPLNDYVCAGVLPGQDWSMPSHFGAHFEVFTVLTIIFVKLKIHLYKTKSIESKMTKRSIFMKNFTLQSIDKSSLTSFSISFAGLLMFSSFVFMGMSLNKLPPLDVNKSPFRYWYHTLHLILPSLVNLTFCSFFYLRNPKLRSTVALEFKNYIDVKS